MPLKHTVEEFKLKNGIKGLIIDVPDSTVVSYNINFRAGYDYTNHSIQQVAHLVEHLSFGVNDKFSSAEEFSQEFSKNGATIRAVTENRSMNYASVSAIMELERIINLFKLGITHPKYTQKTLDAEKGNVREELMSQADNYGRVLFQKIVREMGDSRLMDLEKIETIEKVTISDIEDYYKKTHTLNNMRFVIAGDLSTYKKMIIDNLNTWEMPSGERFSPVRIPLKSSPMVYIYRKDVSNLIFEFNVCLDRRFSLAEDYAMGALNHILTGTFHSRIFGKARSQGICYHIGSGFINDTAAGLSEWEFYGRVGIENADALFKLIVDQLKKVIEGDISEAELDAAKQYALGLYQMKGQTVGAISGWYLTDYFNDEIIEPIESSPELIRSTKLSDIVKLARELVEKGEWTLGGIGNISEEQLQSNYDLLSTLFKKAK